jgi:hypothetical protein
MEILINGNNTPSRQDVSWDKSGQINAYSNTDARQLITKYAAEGGPNYDQTISSLIPADKQEQLLSRFSDSNSQARTVLGQAMASPLKTFLEYKGVMRKAFKVDPLAPGAVPIYDRDTEHIEASVIASQAAAHQTKIEGERIFVPVFQIAAHPTIKLLEVKIRRFNIIDRIQVRTRQFMQEAEDAAIINLLNTASTATNTEVQANVTSNGYIKRSDMINLKRQVEQHDLFTTSYFMSIYRFNDIAMWGRDEVDLITQKQLIDTGLLAKLHGLNIYVTKKMPKNTVFVTTDPDYLGVMPVYQDIEVIPADLPWQGLFGWLFIEILGLAVFNSKGCANMTCI